MKAMTNANEKKCILIKKANDWLSVYACDDGTVYVEKGDGLKKELGYHGDTYVIKPNLANMPRTREEAERLISSGDVIKLHEKSLQEWHKYANGLQRDKWNQEALSQLQMNFIDSDWENGQVIYGLSARISANDWKKVGHLFQHIDTSRDEDSEWSGHYRGWATSRRGAEEVERILSIPHERTLAYREEQSKIAKAETELRDKQCDELLTRIEQSFENAVYPNPGVESPDEANKYSKGFEKMKAEGETIQHPVRPENLYGGGQWWVIDKDKNRIWNIKNNGADGDDWGRNNIETGGAGAIGVYVPYTAGLDEMIHCTRQYRRVEKGE